MSTRTFEFQVDDICEYQKSSNDFIYVEPCEKDYSCQQVTSSSSFPSVAICRKNILEELSYFGASCEGDDDCYSTLKCVEKKCTLEENDYAIEIEYIFYCPDNLIPIMDNTGYKCKKRDKHKMDGLCYLKEDSGDITNALPDYNKICGEITFDKAENNYQILKKSVNSLGSVDNGKFVLDEKACRSGFALKFYPNGAISDTTSTFTTSYKKCVQFDGIEYKKNSGTCKIKYILDNKNLVYDVDKVDNNIISSTYKSSFCDGFKFKEIKLDLFKQYVNKVSELGDKCTNNKYYDEPYTCKNDELRKLIYFYDNIEKYLLYKNEDEISEFLLQQEYPSYGVKFSKTDGSGYLSNKFICLLILLLL
jgi:hypothetical protein